MCKFTYPIILLTDLIGYVVGAGKLTNNASKPCKISGYRFSFMVKDKDFVIRIKLI